MPEPDLHSYPWYPRDWRESETVMCMTAEQRGIYRELLDETWLRGSLPAEDRMLLRMANCTPEEWERSRDVVLACFELRDGRLWNPKVDEKRPQVLQSKDDRKKGGKARAETAPRMHGRFTSSAGEKPPAEHQLSYQLNTSSAPAGRPAKPQPPPSPSPSPANPQPLVSGLRAHSARNRENGADPESTWCKAGFADEIEARDWYDALHAEHPNAKKREMGWTQLLDLVARGQFDRAVFAANYERNRGSPRWREEGGRFVPNLAAYLADGEWRREPQREVEDW